ncbi:MAG TPA: hypothetical protein VMD59_24485 [Acidimicrobiales bacterium]|nr:hypothetical protein [Acidimicrobiales bacterium]
MDHSAVIDGAPSELPDGDGDGSGAMYLTGRGAPFQAGSWLAQGGQGVIYEVVGRPDLVFKRYKSAERSLDVTLRDRLEVMVQLQPAGWREAQTQHVMLAWPTETVFDEAGFAGYLMPRIDAVRSARLLRVWDPSDREAAEPPNEWLRGFNWRYLVMTGSNLALGLEALHASDVVIGDFNDANVAVTPEARVTFFDCDSMQLSDRATGRQYLCRVTRPEFTAPELIGVDLQTTFRTRSSDLFALAVHLYQLLLQGEHPFRGHWNGTDDPPREQVLARDGMWTYAGRSELTPRPSAIGLELLPRDIGELFRRAFVEGAQDPERRPTATEWRVALERLGRSLVQCAYNEDHWFAASFSECPWCRHARRQAMRVARGPASAGAGTARGAGAARAGAHRPAPARAARAPRPRYRRRSRIKVAVSSAAVVIVLAAAAMFSLVHFSVVRPAKSFPLPCDLFLVNAKNCTWGHQVGGPGK